MALEDTGTLANALTRLGIGKEDPDRLSSLQLRNTPGKWQAHRQKRIVKIIACPAWGGNIRRPTTNCVMQVLGEWLIWAVLWWTGSVERMRWIFAYDIHLALIRVRDAK
jgi:hypothetical protein